MSLSRPIYNLLGFYFEQLFQHPVRTKCITSCVIAASANYTSQKLSGSKKTDQDTVFAYGLFGLLFGGTLPHYFYQWIETAVPEEIRFRRIIQFFLERFGFAPVFQAVSLYFLSRFEGNDHAFAVKNMLKLYWPILQANWKYLSLLILLNVIFVPPMLRVLFSNLIGFWWIVFVGNKRRKAAALAKKASADRAAATGTAEVTE